MIKLASPALGEAEKRAVVDVLDSGIIAQGPMVKEFEDMFSQYCQCSNAIAVNNGTAALHCTLHALGIQPGDEVITTPFTFIATAHAILIAGATPVFVDIKEDTFNIDPDKIQEKISDKTKAIIVVDLYGQLAEYDRIKRVTDLPIIEDASQSIGALHQGKKAGSFGAIATFSFYATKNIATGEGGMVVTPSADYAEKVRQFRNHGWDGSQYTVAGYNYRMSDIFGAIGIEQMKKVEELTEKRIQNAIYLSEHLKDTVIVPFVLPNTRHVFHQYTIKVKNRDTVLQRLQEKGIEAKIFYPQAIHLYPHFRKLGYKEGDYPVAERVSKEVLSLPVHPKLTQEELDIIINTIKECVQ